jgi:hypothetical protein
MCLLNEDLVTLDLFGIAFEGPKSALNTQKARLKKKKKINLGPL